MSTNDFTRADQHLAADINRTIDGLRALYRAATAPITVGSFGVMVLPDGFAFYPSERSHCNDVKKRREYQDAIAACIIGMKYVDRHQMAADIRMFNSIKDEASKLAVYGQIVERAGLEGEYRTPVGVVLINYLIPKVIAAFIQSMEAEERDPTPRILCATFENAILYFNRCLDFNDWN